MGIWGEVCLRLARCAAWPALTRFACAAVIAVCLQPLCLSAQTVPAPGAPATLGSPGSGAEQITVLGNQKTAGGGAIKAESGATVTETLSSAYIQQQSPTANALVLMQSLPSVNVSTPDAFGMNGGGNVQIHGLSTNDLGWILDSVPVYSQGAAFANEIVAVQDLETLTVSPGSSNLSDPTISSAGGTIYLHMRDPSMTPGGYFETAWGSDEVNKQFLRYDTGLIGDTGVRAFLSFAHMAVNNWRGAGSTDQKHIDFKAMKDFSDGSKVAFEVSSNQGYYGYYYYPTAAQAENYKADYSQFNTNSKYTGIGDTAYYLLNQQDPFNFISLQLPIHYVISDHFSIDEAPYMWLGIGGGTGGTDLTQGSTYQGSLPANVDLTDGGKIPLTNGQVLASTGFFEKQLQAGNVIKLNAVFGPNTGVFGYWYENNNQGEEDPVGKVNQATGEPYTTSIGGSMDGNSIYRLANGLAYYANHNNQRYVNNTLFIGDTLSLLGGRLTVTAGTKVAMLEEWATNLLPGAHYKNGFSDAVPLPQAAIHYQIDENNQVFVHVERDYRLPATSSLPAYYSLGSGAITSNYSSPHPELAFKEEVGYRYQSGQLLADISFFNIDLSNRLLTLNTYVDNSPLASTVNAGGQNSHGIDAQLGTKPIFEFFSPYVSFEWLDATITTNTASPDENGAPDFLPTKGKVQVQSPEFQGALGLTFKDGPYGADVRLRFVASQYSTLMDDEKEPGYVTDDMSFSYQLPKMGFGFEPKLQLNLFNITNALFRTGVYQFQFNAKNTVGVNGGIIPASGSPTYYLEPNFAAVISLSTPF